MQRIWDRIQDYEPKSPLEAAVWQRQYDDLEVHEIELLAELRSQNGLEKKR